MPSPDINAMTKNLRAQFVDSKLEASVPDMDSSTLSPTEERSLGIATGDIDATLKLPSGTTIQYIQDKLRQDIISVSAMISFLEKIIYEIGDEDSFDYVKGRIHQYMVEHSRNADLTYIGKGKPPFIQEEDLTKP